MTRPVSNPSTQSGGHPGPGGNADGDRFETPDAPPASAGGGSALVGRPWIGVEFTCAGQYMRVYRHPDGTKYLATCPTCGRCTRFRVAPGGTSSRLFQVSCR